MKKLTSYLVLFFLITSLGNGYYIVGQNSLETSNSEFEILVDYFESNGDFINSVAPAIVSSNEVKKNLKNEKYHVIDIRSESWYDYGHIKNASNVKASDLLTYFESEMTPSDYDKIVLVCYSGQSAAYYTGLLRLAGYDNAYSMKWGMSSWRVDFAENAWLKNTGNSQADLLQTEINPKHEKGAYPELNTGKTTGKEILKVRLEEAFATPYREHIIKSPVVFENPENFYIVNYWDDDKYTSGHITDAVQYQPQASLSSSTDLYTLPIDEQVLVYCSTGQTAAYVVAYLNLIGYDAGNLAYGANSFMNKTLKTEGWNGFSKKEVNMYPVIE